MAAGFAVVSYQKWASVESKFDDEHEWEDFAQLREGAAIPDYVEYHPKYAIAADLIEDAFHVGIEHVCVIADANYGMRSSFRKQLRELDKPNILDVETGRPYLVPEELEIVEPVPTTGRGPLRKYRSFSEGIDAKSNSKIAGELYDDVWTEATWIKVQKVNSVVRSTVVAFVSYRMRINVYSKTKPAGYCFN